MARICCNCSEVSFSPSSFIHWIDSNGMSTSTFILFASHKHDEKYGPKSTHAREADSGQEEPKVTEAGEEATPNDSMEMPPV